MREQPEQQAPPVQRLRVRYAKRGRMRFASHRDFSRAFERAVVRSRIPVAYSSGFHPHPRISYAGAAPTGAASEAEYLELGLAEQVEPADALTAIAAVMPHGLDVVAVAESPGGSLADLLTASRWRIDLLAPYAGLDAALVEFLARESVLVTRMTRKGVREFDCRAAVISLLRLPGAPAGAPGHLDLVLRHREPAVRPDDVLAGIRVVSGLAPPAAPLLTRLEQGTLDESTGTIADPLGGAGAAPS